MTALFEKNLRYFPVSAASLLIILEDYDIIIC